MKTYLTRIVTFMDYPQWGSNPQAILEDGSRVITAGTKVRVFTVRQVFYDESMTPLYSMPEFMEDRFTSLRELKEKLPHHSPVFDSPILDRDNFHMVWEELKEVKL